MKKYLLFLVFLIACGKKEAPKEQAINEDVPESENWMVYEGVVRSDEGNDVKMALSLLQGEVGLVSKYKTEEEFISNVTEAETQRMFSSGFGTYTLLYGASNNETIIRIKNNNAHSFGWINPSYGITPEDDAFKAIKAKAKITELTFLTRINSDELILVDDNLIPISADNRYTLKKRSVLFTVEGLLTISPDGKEAEFYEINTMQTWPVAKAGAFGEVNTRYTKLAIERNEGIYTKAVGYYFNDLDSVGKEIQPLVIKKIIEMQSYEAMNKRREFMGRQELANKGGKIQ